MYRVFTFFTLFFLAHLPGRSQQLNYVHYDTKDGLAGSTVYGVTQDIDGFIWFATDFGVSRFDGKRFRNFTTDDGLPDNEIMDVSIDSMNRVWTVCFNGKISYLQKGKVFTENNTPLIKRLNELGVLTSVNSYPDKSIFFAFNKTQTSWLLENNNQLKKHIQYETITRLLGGKKITTPVGLKKLSVWQRVFVADNKIYRHSKTGNTIQYIKPLPGNLHSYKILLLRGASPDSLFAVDFFSQYNSISESPETPDSIGAFINANNGCFPVSTTGKLEAPYLPGKKISKTLCDREGNLWFTTLGEGVYKLTTSSMKTFGAGKEFFSIGSDGSNLYAGDNTGAFHHIDASGTGKESMFTQFDDNGNQRRLYSMKVLPDGSIILGFDCFLLKYRNGQIVFSDLRPIKSIDYINEQKIAVSTNYFTYHLWTSDLKISDTFFRERGTKILYRDGKNYIGTLHGLVIVNANKNITELGKRFPILSNRIADMCWTPEGGLFIATNDKGVVKYGNDTLLQHFHLENGLSSNICRSLYCSGQTLWVGTNKGLNKINLLTGKVVAQYTMANGLPSDIINAIHVQGNMVWVGTPGGLTYFNEEDISNNSICNLVMERIVVSGRTVDSANNLNLNWRQNNILFEFSGISMKAAGDITYRYRLNGLDETWKETKQNSLSYPSLPSGKYTLEIYAVNKFGRQSNVITVEFSIATPFWKTTWFWVFTGLALASIIILLLNRRYRQNLRRRDEKNRVAREISEARQQALQAQMNPHFVFNCLNSIQQFIMLNEKEKANKYLTEFAHLIRKTLENSEKKNVTVAAEIAYLRQYLEMEQLRYGDAFDFTIEINKELQADFTEIPAMLLQPYIENCLRHGIRHKTNGKGLIELRFLQENNLLTCVVKDNGIGRAAAQRLKSAQHIEYQSKGMALTARRIELLNTQGNAGIKVLVNDVSDEAGNITGTEVIIQIPLK